MNTNFTNNLRPYHGDADLPKILQAIGEWYAQTGGCGYLHPGDVCHYLSNGLRGQDPAPYLHLYEEDGRLIALVLLYPRHAGYEVLLDPRYRGGALETALLTWAEGRMWALMQESGETATSVGADVTDCDTLRRDLLVQLGYAPAGDPTYAYTTRSLEDPIPASELPEGFTIRATTGEQEAVALGEVHSSAFGSSWPGDAYRAVMQTPAYRFGRELVVVAPDERLAAFLIYWCDPVSRSGLFEPVGCHTDFQRRGLTKALMYEGMRQMRAGHDYGYRPASHRQCPGRGPLRLRRLPPQIHDRRLPQDEVAATQRVAATRNLIGIPAGGHTMRSSISQAWSRVCQATRRTK